MSSAIDFTAEIRVEESPIGRRIRVDGPFEECHRTQDIVLWDGVERVELATRLDDYTGHDRLFRVRFAAAVDGGAPGLGGRQRRRWPWLRLPERRRRRGPVHARQPRLQLVRAGRHRPDRARRPGRAQRRRPPRARDRRRRGDRPRRRATRRCSPSPRHRPRPAGRYLDALNATTARGTASCTSIRTCPTSGWRSVAPPRTTSSGASSTPLIRPIKSELDRQLAAGGSARLWVPATDPRASVVGRSARSSWTPGPAGPDRGRRRSRRDQRGDRLARRGSRGCDHHRRAAARARRHDRRSRGLHGRCPQQGPARASTSRLVGSSTSRS